MDTPAIIHVCFSQYEGGYIATSEDCRGLFVSHSSALKVIQTVPRAIKLLFKAKGVDVEVREDTEHRPHSTDLKGLEVAFIAEAA